MSGLDEFLSEIQARVKLGPIDISINGMKGVPEYVDWECKKCLNTIRVPRGVVPGACPMCMSSYASDEG